MAKNVSVKVDGIFLLTVVGIGAAAYVYFNREKVAAKVNPASSENFIYDDVVGGIGREMSGDENWSLGGWIYDITH